MSGSTIIMTDNGESGLHVRMQRMSCRGMSKSDRTSWLPTVGAQKVFGRHLDARVLYFLVSEGTRLAWCTS
jgi:hypothetical protein